MADRLQIVIPDGRLTEEAKLGILDQADCWHWIASSECIESAEVLPLQRKGLQLHFMPTLDFWLRDRDDFTVYPFDVTFDQVRDEKVLVIHTSGTTGNDFPCSAACSYKPSISPDRFRPAESSPPFKRLACDHLLASTTSRWFV
jgi:hypothetical protein